MDREDIIAYFVDTTDYTEEFFSKFTDEQLEELYYNA